MDSLFPRRLLSHFLDLFVLSFLVSFPIAFFLKVPEQGVFSLAVTAYTSLAGVLYWTLSDFFIGASIGKAIFRLRTISTIRNCSPNIVQAAIRNIAKLAIPLLILDTLPLIFGKGKGGLRYSERLAKTKVTDWKE